MQTVTYLPVGVELQRCLLFYHMKDTDMCSSQWNLTRHQSQELFWNIHLCPSIQAMIQGKMLHHSFDDGETLEGMADVPCLISIRALNVSLFLTSNSLCS